MALAETCRGRFQVGEGKLKDVGSAGTEAGVGGGGQVTQMGWVSPSQTPKHQNSELEAPTKSLQCHLSPWATILKPPRSALLFLRGCFRCSSVCEAREHSWYWASLGDTCHCLLAVWGCHREGRCAIASGGQTWVLLAPCRAQDGLTEQQVSHTRCQRAR